MRIIAGKYRGRRLVAPPGRTTRPTTDRIRESLFSILGDLHDLVVWDAFAGSGALGLEALSRGARHALFTETNRNALQTIKKNVELLDLSDSVSIRRVSFFTALTNLEILPDLIFFDPPYGEKLHDKILSLVAEAPTVPSGTDLVFEISSHDHLAIPNDLFCDIDERVYGSTRLIFLRKGP